MFYFRVLVHHWLIDLICYIPFGVLSVFIGLDLDKDYITERLKECLVAGEAA